MSSVQRFLSGHNNAARTALLSASSVRAAEAIERTDAQRAGNGRLRLAGPYTGHEATEIEVEVTSAAGTPRASAPAFAGVGSGTLEVLAVDALAPLQAITLTLADLGVPTRAAALDVREVQIRARAAGAAGNALRITVTPQLVRTPTERALLAGWSVGQTSQVGEQWDFGGLPLSAQGELDAASPRIAFGHDPQVYRPWRQFKDGAWRFGLSPELQRDVPAGAKVYAVTGGYEVQVSDGSTTELYGADPGAPIVTFYDLLAELADSALVEVAGVVTKDRTVGGQAAVDVPLRTSAWLLASQGVRLEDVSVPHAARTQTITVTCTNADTVGQERWAVAGDVDGALASATTGQPYSSAAVAFTVPRLEGRDPTGDWSFTYQPQPRSVDEGLPSVCLRPFKFGVNAVARTVKFVYSKRPPAECNCANEPTPLVSNRCLGLGGEDMGIEDAEYRSRLEAIYAWREAFVRSNTRLRPAGMTPGQPATPGTPGIPGTPDVVVYGFFSRVESVGVDAIQIESVDKYGTRQDAQNALDMVTGETIPGGTVLGAQLSLNGQQVKVSAIFDRIGGASKTVTDSDASHWYGSSTTERTEYGTPDTPGTPGTPARPGSSYGVAYLAYKRDLDWMESAIAILLECLGHVYEEPAALGAWDALWLEVQADLAHLDDTGDDIAKDAEADPRFLDRYRATVDNILLSVGIAPKSDPSSSNAGSCWVDHDDAFWWVDPEGEYLPAFTNQAYISARRDADGKPYSTMEFGFGLVVACPDRLKEGDAITVRIRQVDGDRPYRVGDVATLQTVGAGPAWLVGGVDGTDELTWHVHGSASGALADYVLPTDGASAPVWEHAGVRLALALGGIPFALGDTFGLTVEAGQFRWRRAGAAWSADADIPPSGPALLADGLALHFEPGAAPSFVPGDSYRFAVHQPWAASHVQQADARAWGWAGAAAQLEIDLGSVQPLGALALARYRLPDGAVVTAQLSDDGSSWGAPLALDVSSGPVCVAMLPAQAQARHVRLSVSAAPDGHIGWVWAGQPLATGHHASQCTRRRSWAVQRGEGVNPAALYAGRGDGWDVAWQAGDTQASVLFDADLQALVGMLDFVHARGEPIIFVPHHLHPAESALVRAADDALEVSDIHAWQPDSAGQRLMSATLRLEPVYA